MPHTAAALRFHLAESATDPLVLLGDQTHAHYMRSYLSDQLARVIVEEPHYFDRDYLAEFGAFYAASARGYPNDCRRLSFFDNTLADVALFRSCFDQALGGDVKAGEKLQAAFLGFIVLRPIAAAPFGRTVLKSYRPEPGALARVMEPCRPYYIHLAGQRLRVDGLAWQQQDRGVSACATIALWSMLHSSAFHERHSIPTTVDVTRAAHRTASLGRRVFPSAGLLIEQLLEAIKEQHLSPIILGGDREIILDQVPIAAFTQERFCGTCAALLRSGYPVLIEGVRGGGHAVCAVGFRPAPSPSIAEGSSSLEDAAFKYLYIHDDNIGPSVRFRVEVNPIHNVVQLVPDAPAPPAGTTRPVPDPCVGIEPLIPRSIVVAVHDDVRVTPDRIHEEALVSAEMLAFVLGLAQHGMGPASLPLNGGVGVAPKFVRLSRYLAEELRPVVAPALLARVKLALCEDVVPMSYHVAVARFGVEGTALLDVIYDTTETELTCAPFAHVVFTPLADQMVDTLTQSDPEERRRLFGEVVRAY